MAGLIYLVIIALWAAVLIPMWLRRHDQGSEVRSTTQFSAAMQLLSSGASSDVPVGPKDGRVAELGGDEWLWEQHRSYIQAVAARRRFRAIVLMGGMATLVIAHVLTFVDVTSRWLPIIFAMALLGYLIGTSRVAANEAMHPFAIYEGQRIGGTAPLWSDEIPAVDIVRRSGRRPAAVEVVTGSRDTPAARPAFVSAAGATRTGVASRSRRDTDIQRRRDTVAQKRRDTVARKRRDTEVQEMLLAEEMERRDIELGTRIDYRAQTAPIPIIRGDGPRDRRAANG